MTSQFFRANVGVMVARPDGCVLVLERVDKPGQWQLPQGGLDVGEEPREAALRELQEETGIAPVHVELLAEHPGWLAYELPPERRRQKTGRGQVQKWFLFRFLGADSDIDLEPPPGDIEEVWEVRRPIYEALIDEWSDRLTASR